METFPFSPSFYPLTIEQPKGFIMAKSATTRKLMISDIQSLINLTNRTEYNCKAALKHAGKPFRNHKSFELPDTTPEQTKRYVYNNLIELKNLLNSVELGEKIEDNQDDSEY